MTTLEKALAYFDECGIAYEFDQFGAVCVADTGDVEDWLEEHCDECGGYTGYQFSGIEIYVEESYAE